MNNYRELQKILLELPVAPQFFIVHDSVYKELREQWGEIPDFIVAASDFSLDVLEDL